MPARIRKSVTESKERSMTLITGNQYIQNRSRLSLLPTLFIVSVIIGLVGILTVYFDPFSWRMSKPSNVAGVFDKVQAEIKSNITLPTPNDSTEVSSKMKDTELDITSESGKICRFDETSDPAGIIEPIIIKQPEAFWITENCSESTLVLQIVRLNKDELMSITTSGFLKENIQNLDTQDTYAIIYTADKMPTTFKLQSYLIRLTHLVFTDRMYLNLVAPFDVNRTGPVTYFLDGKCDGGGEPGCFLWRMDNFSGDTTLLDTQPAESGMGQSNELHPGFYLRFAKTQDVDGQLNLIIVNEQSLDYKLISISLGTLKPLHEEELKPEDKKYRDYFR